MTQFPSGVITDLKSHLSSRLPALLSPNSLDDSEKVLIKPMGKSIFAHEKEHVNY